MRSCIFILVITSFSLFGFSQKPVLKFDKTAHDFGTIKEEYGPVSYKFEFTNVGTVPLTINNVEVSCGCTTPDWTKTPVLPGKKGFVSATFDPKNRPGKFDKNITVTSNATEPKTVLVISGEVSEKVKTAEDLYPERIGDLRLQLASIPFAKIKNTEVRTESVETYNGTDKEMKIGFGTFPAHLSAKAIPAVLKPKEKGKIDVTFDAKKKSEWDFVMDRIPVIINDKTDPSYNLVVSATIEEDFSALGTDQLAKAPVLNFPDKTWEFGTVKQSDKPEYSFTFTNTGKSDLLIRKVKSSCNFVIAEPSANKIGAGKSGTLKVTIDPKGKTGNQHKTITLITNDPKNSKIVLWVKGAIN